MVVCKFFQEGNCRYGQNCRFDHIYGSKYSFKGADYNNKVSQPVQSNTSGVTDEQLVNQVQADIQSALKGGQWILSCYAPFKEKPNFPGLSDLSMEEARLFIYEAKANNNVEQAVSYINNLIKEARQKYGQLLQPNGEIMKVLRSLYRGEAVSSPFGSNAQISGAASSIFRGAIQNATPFGSTAANAKSIFGQAAASNNSIFASNTNNSVFGQTATAASVMDQKPSFGGSSENPARSIFAQATQDVFGQNQTPNVFGGSQTNSVFGGSQTANTNVFGGSQATNNVFGGSQTANNVFGAVQTNSNPFGVNQSSNMFDSTKAEATAKSIFAQASQNAFTGNQQPSNVFGNMNQTQSQSVFASSPFSQDNTSVFGNQQLERKSGTDVFSMFSAGNVDEVTIYSDMNDLSPVDVESFKETSFKLGFVPECPPPKSLCV